LDQVLKKLLYYQDKKYSENQLLCHIPFRSTNLTKILKPCLIGNSATRLIVCINPGADSRDESYTSMGFAIRAKKINQRSRSLSIQYSNAETLNHKYKDENAKLKTRVLKLLNENTLLRQKLCHVTNDLLVYKNREKNGKKGDDGPGATGGSTSIVKKILEQKAQFNNRHAFNFDEIEKFEGESKPPTFFTDFGDSKVDCMKKFSAPVEEIDIDLCMSGKKDDLNDLDESLPSFSYNQSMSVNYDIRNPSHQKVCSEQKFPNSASNPRNSNIVMDFDIFHNKEIYTNENFYGLSEKNSNMPGGTGQKMGLESDDEFILQERSLNLYYGGANTDTLRLDSTKDNFTDRSHQNTELKNKGDYLDGSTLIRKMTTKKEIEQIQKKLLGSDEKDKDSLREFENLIQGGQPKEARGKQIFEAIEQNTQINIVNMQSQPGDKCQAMNGFAVEENYEFKRDGSAGSLIDRPNIPVMNFWPGDAGTAGELRGKSGGLVKDILTKNNKAKNNMELVKKD
jgi:hypothetical protein